MSRDPLPLLADLLAVMARLRAPDGCPWDRAQDFDGIAPYTLEEAHEVADAIARRDWAGLLDELGDLLFQVVYHARIAEERRLFAFADVVKSIRNKMIRRHPHVFGEDDLGASPPDWERMKAAERPSAFSALEGVPLALPALTRASKLTARAARVGFDWPDAGAVLDKLEEEAAELRAELPAASPERLRDEVGDLLFVLANLARKLDLDPEACLRGANDKFVRRFSAVESRLAGVGSTPAEAGLDEMERLWTEAKAAERAGISPRAAPSAPPPTRPGPGRG